MASDSVTLQPQHQKQITTPEQLPVEEAPQIEGAQPIQQLQRLVGNQRTQHLITHPTPAINPANLLRRAPGLPPVRGVVQRDGEEEAAPALEEETAALEAEAPASVPASTSSAAAAFAAVPESAINLTDTQIRRAIWFNQHRFPRQSISALRRYFEQPEGTQFDADMIRAIARYQEHFGLGTDGKIGATTYDHIDLHLMLESTVTDTPLTDDDLIFSINVSQEGTRWDYDFMTGTAPPMRFRTVSRFNVDVLFPQSAHPEQYRYRQMIKGRFEAVLGTASQDLTGIFNKIPGTLRLPADFTEDGNTDWTSTGIFYGRRTDAGQRTATETVAQNQYVDEDGSANQRRGSRYLASDGPKAIVTNLQPGTTLRLNMEFLGQIVRLSDGQVMQQKRWTAFDFVDLVPNTPGASGA